MSDNTQLNFGAGGDLLATDDIGGVKYQRVKLTYGDDGVAVDASSTNPVPTADLTARETLEAVKALNDSLLYFTTALLDKLPRLDRSDRANVMVSDASGNELNSAYYGVASNSVGEATGGRNYSRIMEPWYFSDTGSARIYQQIIVS